MKIEILSLFPEFFKGPFDASIMKRAQAKGLIEIRHVNIRDFASDKRKSVDDRPYGGGAGMLLKPEPLYDALQSVRRQESHVVYLSPRGKPLTTKKAEELADRDHLILIAGHYEGIDERLLQEIDEEISIGDYVLTNGCISSIVLIDAVSRFVPGVLGDSSSSEKDSFSQGLLEHGHYTRPASFRGKEVPRELLGGDHGEVEVWRNKDALKKTFENREDLYVRYLTQRGEGVSFILEVRDLEKSIRFYRKVLGFALEYRAEDRAIVLIDEGRRLLLVAGHLPYVGGAIYLKAIADEDEWRKIKARVIETAPFFDAADEKKLYCRDLEGHLWMMYFNIEEKENG